MENKEQLTLNNQLTVKEQFEVAQQEVFTSLVDDGSIKTKATIFNAMNDTDYSLRDMVGKTIYITNFVAHKIQLTDEKTGEVSDAVRCVFIDKDGKTYGTVSNGVNSAMIKLFATVGLPNVWDSPMPIKVLEKTGRKGYRFLTINLDL